MRSAWIHLRIGFIPRPHQVELTLERLDLRSAIMNLMVRHDLAHRFASGQAMGTNGPSGRKSSSGEPKTAATSRPRRWKVSAGWKVIDWRVDAATTVYEHRMICAIGPNAQPFCQPGLKRSGGPGQCTQLIIEHQRPGRSHCQRSPNAHPRSFKNRDWFPTDILFCSRFCNRKRARYGLEMFLRQSKISFLGSIVIDADSELTMFPDGLEFLFSQFSC